eukprot:TRINITY_DN2531_c0_g1_i1.p1 TRINITY_DN2531_c0_g1~~TRINITY_DN2531_c0_g1_i1.p1  ORF type:complete len:520 (-),score=147.18 TRINITY_DN2531_c0_g1_i1:143-1507(-)
MMLFGENPGKFVGDYSRQFETAFLGLLRMKYRNKRIKANTVYQEYIQDRQHVHMNSTAWTTLTGFVKYLGRQGRCEVDETPKGWYVKYLDRDPEAIRRQEALQKKEKLTLDDEERTLQLMQRRMEIAAAAEAQRTGSAETAASATEAKSAENELPEFATEEDRMYYEYFNDENAAPEDNDVGTGGTEDLEPYRDTEVAGDKAENDEGESGLIAFRVSERGVWTETVVGADEDSAVKPKEEVAGKEKEATVAKGADAQMTATEPEKAIPMPLPQAPAISMKVKVAPVVTPVVKRTIAGFEAAEGPTPPPTKKLKVEEIKAYTTISTGSQPLQPQNSVKRGWLYKGLVVKVKVRHLADGAYYEKKGVIEQVAADGFSGEVRMLDTKHLLRLDQDQLETVIPALKGRMMVVGGEHKGQLALLKEIHVDKFCATIVLLASREEVEAVDYSDICKLQAP